MRDKEFLDIYGFWLWHYIMQFIGNPSHIQKNISLLKSFEILCQCKDKKQKCSSCQQLKQFKQNKFLMRIFVPWTEYCNNCEAESLTYQCDDLLKNAVEYSSGNAELVLDKRFVVNRLGIATTPSKIRRKKSIYGMDTEYFFNLSSDLSLPSSLVGSDVARLHAYCNHLKNTNKRHSQEKLHDFLIGIGEKFIDYQHIAKVIRKEKPNYISKKDFLARAIGYWLYDKLKSRVEQKISSKLINELYAFVHEANISVDIEKEFDQHNRYFYTRVLARTRACIKEGRIFNLT